MEIKYLIRDEREDHVTFLIGIVDDYDTAFKMVKELGRQMAIKLKEMLNVEEIKVGTSEEIRNEQKYCEVIVNDEYHFYGTPLQYYKWRE